MLRSEQKCAHFRSDLHVTQCSIQKRNVPISVLNGVLWDVEQVHSGICELGDLSSNELQRFYCLTVSQHGSSSNDHKSEWSIPHWDPPVIGKMNDQPNTVRSLYIAIIFLRIPHENTPLLAHNGEVWGVVRKYKSDRSFITVIVVLCALSYNIQSRHIESL